MISLNIKFKRYIFVTKYSSDDDDDNVPINA